ncbi:MAG: hypothetical protein AMXMBFR61_19060 [Fimbriimonadales bacterium]
MCGLACVAFAALANVDLSAPGPYQPGWTRVTVSRTGGGSFSAYLFYPALLPGENTPFDASAAPCPGISFGHGFLQPVTRYRSTLEHLSTWGHIVIASESEGGLFPSHSRFASDMRDCLTWLTLQNANPSSALYRAVNTNAYGMSGHSMGGGCSILATAADPRVKALANLAAAETNPSAIAQMPNVLVPVSLIAGSQDGIVPVSTNGQRMYDAGGPPRLLPVITGGWHCGFEDVSSFGCDSGSLPRADQLRITRRLLTGFFNLYLKHETALWRDVWGPEAAGDPEVVTQFDPGIRLTPTSQTKSAPAGRTVTYDVLLQNRGRGPLTFLVEADDHAWREPVILQPKKTLAVGEEVLLRVFVTVPSTGPASDTIVLSVRSATDGRTRGYAILATIRQ